MTDDVRARLRVLRHGIAAEEQARRADALVTAVAGQGWWLDGRRVGLYRAVRGELDPSGLERSAWQRGVETYAPVLAGDRLQFARSSPSTVWAPNRFGIDEPDDVEPVEATSLDLVIVPAVAVDRSGNRLGMGAGYYDRTFADRPRPLLVATIHPEQLVDHLPAEPWDVPVDVIALPGEVIVITSGAS